jgi:hypothetical protein
MSQSYTDTIILEANRRHSAQYENEQDTSLWINQVNDGLQLNVGDQVSVHSAMISNLGAEDGTIEFKGKELVPVGEQIYTESVLSTPDEQEADTRLNGITGSNVPYVTEVYSNVNSSNSLPINDNEAKIAVNYYKNANGEYMICLPSMWGWNNASPTATAPDVGWNPDTGRRNQNVSGTTIQFNLDQKSGYGQVIVSPGLDRRCPADWTSRDGKYCYNAYKESIGNASGQSGHVNTFRTQTKCDNSRFQLFVKTRTRFQIPSHGVTDVQFCRDIAIRDPALYDYIPFQTLIDISVPIGFNSPSEIAEQITQTLNALQDTGEIELTYQTNPYPNSRAPEPYMSNASYSKQTISRKQVTNTYKLFNAMTPKDHSQLQCSAFFGQRLQIATDPLSLSRSMEYLRAYQFIGFKRPEFVRLGRQVAKLFPSTYKEGDDNFSEARSCLDSSGWIDGRAGNNPGFRQDAYTYNYSTIVTNLEWTESNVKTYYNWFVEQGNYPELFELPETSVYKHVNQSNTAHQYRGNASDITINTHRFVHMNIKDSKQMPTTRVGASVTADVFIPANDEEGKTIFGYDGYQTNVLYASGTTDLTDYTSVPLFILYNPLDKDYTNFEKAGNFGFNFAPPDFRYLYGGIMMRGLNRATGIYDRIAFLAQVPEQYCTLTDSAGAVVQYPNPTAHNKWLAGYNNETGFGPIVDYDIRRIGYDKHFSAYGNSAIGLWNGYVNDLGITATGNAFGNINTDYGAETGTAGLGGDIGAIQRQIYIGSNEPLFNFNTTKSRFEISQLHCAEREGNTGGAGIVNPSLDWKGNEVPDTLLGKEVYKINKRLTESNFSPSMIPYAPKSKYWIPEFDPSNASGINVIPDINPFLEKMVVYDSHSGLLINNWGIPKKYWDNSIWGVMGFTYRQLNPQADGITGNINVRITSTTDNDISYVTTNADFISADSLALTANPLSKQLHNPTIITPTYNVNGPHGSDLFVDPAFTIVTSSATISAANLPTKTLRPYYTIRSDILTDSYYFGGIQQGSVLPVISVVDKMNQYGDFFYKQSGELVFTVTNPLTITSITTAVCDPDGEPAVLSPNSCVLYKIVKANNARSDIVQQIQEQAQQNKK